MLDASPGQMLCMVPLTSAVFPSGHPSNLFFFVSPMTSGFAEPHPD